MGRSEIAVVSSGRLGVGEEGGVGLCGLLSVVFPLAWPPLLPPSGLLGPALVDNYPRMVPQGHPESPYVGIHQIKDMISEGPLFATIGVQATPWAPARLPEEFPEGTPKGHPKCPP